VLRVEVRCDGATAASRDLTFAIRPEGLKITRGGDTLARAESFRVEWPIFDSSATEAWWV